MPSDGDDPEEIQRKLSEFSDFVRLILRPDYAALNHRVEACRTEIAEYKDLETRLRETKGHATLLVDFDLGHPTVYCAATVQDATKVVIDLGLGYHAELTIDEALLFISKRIDFLTKHVLQHHTSKANKVMAHIQAMEQMLDALSMELSKQR